MQTYVLICASILCGILLSFMCFSEGFPRILVNCCFHYREAMLDPMSVFALLFGSELFEDYIGHLAVASMASSEFVGESDYPEKMNDKLKASSVTSKLIGFQKH